MWKLKLMDVSHLRNIFAFHPTSRETQQQWKFRHVIFFITIAWEVAADIHPTWDSHYTESFSMFWFYADFEVAQNETRELLFAFVGSSKKEDGKLSRLKISSDVNNALQLIVSRLAVSAEASHLLSKRCLSWFLGLSCLCWRCKVSRRCITLRQSLLNFLPYSECEEF